MLYTQRLKESIIKNQSTLCIGLDPDFEKIPALFKSADNDMLKAYTRFCQAIIEHTHAYAAAYKPNMAFFESLGSEGWLLYEHICDLIPKDKIVITDAKRGDIGNTSKHYAKAFWTKNHSSAITLNPLMGIDSLDGFLNSADKAVYLLALTSNASANDFLTATMSDGRILAVHIAEKAAAWNKNSKTEIGMVIGATQVELAKEVLEVHPESNLLIPGLGAQGGDVEGVINLLQSHAGLALINSSRAIIYAGNQSYDMNSWASSINKAAQLTRDSLSKVTALYV